MDRALSAWPARGVLPALVLALGGPCAAYEAPSPDATLAAVPAARGSRADVAFLPALRADEPGVSGVALRELARGTLLRASLGEQGSLTLRLRSGTLSLVWAVPLSR